MIVFNLTCSNDHRFEGWFVSTADFDKQQHATLLSCPVCGSSQVSKALHAPHVNTSSSPSTRERETGEGSAQYANVGDEVSLLIEHLIANTENVGDAFPEEARRIHYNEAPERKIRGNASLEEVKELREEGIEVIALPVPRHLLDKTH